jgi:hypothetical protein
MNVLVFRLTKDVISVDGVIFRKSPCGVYRADREEYQDLNVFRNYVEAFLKAEKVDNEQEEKKEFYHYLSLTLLENKIKPNDMPF